MNMETRYADELWLNKSEEHPTRVRLADEVDARIAELEDMLREVLPVLPVSWRATAIKDKAQALLNKGE